MKTIAAESFRRMSSGISWASGESPTPMRNRVRNDSVLPPLLANDDDLLEAMIGRRENLLLVLERVEEVDALDSAESSRRSFVPKSE